MTETHSLFAAALDRRPVTGLFLAGVLLGLAGNLFDGPPIGLRSAIGLGVVLALIPVAALVFAFARVIAGVLLVLPLVLLVSLLRSAYLRWRRWQESIVFEQLMVRSYGRPRSPRPRGGGQIRLRSARPLSR